MKNSSLFRNLVGLADPEIIFLLPFLQRDRVDIDSPQSLRRWCLFELEDRYVRPIAASKMVLLGLLDSSAVGSPLDLLEDGYVEKFPPASFLKWRILKNNDEKSRAHDQKLISLLEFPFRNKYPPALTAMAFQKMEEGLENEFHKIISEAADYGEPSAMNMVGNGLLSSSDPVDWVRGLHLVGASADAGFFLSCVRLEGIYRNGGYGVPSDIRKAEYYAAASSPSL